MTSIRSAVRNGNREVNCIFGFFRCHPHTPCIRGLFRDVMWTAPGMQEIILKASSQWLSCFSYKQRTFFFKFFPFRLSGFCFGWVSWNIKHECKNVAQGWMPCLLTIYIRNYLAVRRVFSYPRCSIIVWWSSRKRPKIEWRETFADIYSSLNLCLAWKPH